MRKTDKDGIIELILSIQDAMDYCETADYNMASALFDDCEAALASILNILRNQLSYSAKASYESLFIEFDMAIRLFHNGKTVKIQNGFYQDTKTNLSILMNNVIQESAQYEVVFFPYNATMWDCLESIWLAAKEDPRCICYVVPVPYYDKNSDGSFGTMHYEGELFPDYVQITNFSDYNIEKRRPDIVYIHNPYDKFNKVTSVHPTYYSYNIKPYTKMLVYVPYFITIDHIQEDFCILPGVRFADKVIVQSEQIAEEYKKYYPGEDKDKFLPLGSPKIDKVIEMSKLSREELDIPEEWKKLIGDKKVILYNTHLDNIINKGDLLIKKLSYVLSCFENRDDVVLLWRPHPLSTATASAMKPYLMEEIKNIENDYKKKGFGIYDDTSNLHRSLALADAYFGDWSSLVPMFAVTEKPIMIEKLNLIRKPINKEVKNIPFEDVYIDGEKMWFSSSCFNGLFCTNMITGNTEYKGAFPGESMRGFRLFSKVIEYNNKLLFIPFNAINMAEYDMKNEVFREISIKDGTKYINKFYNGFRYKQYVYVISCEYPVILKYDIEEQTIIYMEKWSELVSNCKNVGKISFLSARSRGNKIYASVFKTNSLFVFDMDNEIVDVVNIGDEDDSYVGVELLEHEIMMISFNKNKLVYYNENTKKTRIEVFDSVNNISPSYIGSSYMADTLYILEAFSSKLIRYKLNTGKAETISTYEELDIENEIDIYNPMMFGNLRKINDEEIWIFPRKNINLIKINNNSTLNEVQVLLPKYWDNTYLMKYLMFNTNNMKYYQENIYADLSPFIELVLDDDTSKNKILFTEEKFEHGKSIHQFIFNYL